MPRYTFADCRRGALEDLGDAADWLRYIDAPASARQRELVREVLEPDRAGKGQARRSGEECLTC